MKIIKCKCPCCNNKIIIKIDNNFNLISIDLFCKNRKHIFRDIELGGLKEGENLING